MHTKDMEFNEQPLTPQEAASHITKFERQYGMSSSDMLNGLKHGTLRVEIHPDDLYEWQSYYAFLSDVTARLQACLVDEAEPLEAVKYSAKSPSHASDVGARENTELALAA